MKVHELPTGVHPVLPDDAMYSKGCRFVAVSNSSVSYHRTAAEAKHRLDDTIACAAHFWHEKVHWHLRGDRTPEGTPVLRIDGWHFVAMSLGVDARAARGDIPAGFGGRTLHWRDLRTGEVCTSNNVWCQGKIPEHLRNQLPDNAVWLPESAKDAA